MSQVREDSATVAAEVPRLPPRRLWHILLYVGPGMILAGNIVGSGELIATPKLSAETGYTLLWLLIFSCIIKTFFQIEIGRYALSTGRTTLESFNELPGPRLGVNWLCWCWVVMAICSIIQLGAMAGGVAQALRLALPFDGPYIDVIYALAVGLSIAVLLATGKYGRIEHIALGMVTLFTIITLYSLISLQFTGSAIKAEDVVHGLSFQFPNKEGAMATALMAFGITGVGASELVAYPYWCLEKGYGKAVGKQGDPTPAEPLPGVAGQDTAPVSEDPDEAWAERAKGWIRVMQYDAWISTAIFTVATVAFFLLGAAMLHARDLVPEGTKMVETLNEMYTETFGAYSKYVFLVGAVCVLYSTFFTASAGNARMLTDWFGLNGGFDRNDPRPRKRGILILSLLIPMVSTTVYLVFSKPVLFVMIGGVSQAFMLPLIGLAVLYFAYSKTDKRLLGGPIWFAMLWGSFVLMTMASLYGGYKLVFGG